MRERLRSLKTSGLAGVVAALWLLFGGPAWAGGASDAGTLQSTLGDLCTSLLQAACPQYATYVDTTTSTPISPGTPIILEIAALQNWTPDQVRIKDSDCMPGGIPTYCPQLGINGINGPVASQGSNNQQGWNNQDEGNTSSPPALSFLNSLAFISAPNTSVPLTATQNSDPTANSFVYAAVLKDKNGQPKTLDLFYNYVAAANPWAPVKVSLAFPLAVLGNGAATETSVVATLTATCSGFGSCSNVKVLASLPGTTKTSFSPSDLGLSFTYSVAPSPNSSSPNPIVELRVPLLLSTQTDPSYFLDAASPGCPIGSNLNSGYCNVFSDTTPPNGFTPKFLTNTAVGMAPSAAPQCPGAQPGTSCPPQTDPTKSPIPNTFGFCAKFSNNLAAGFYLAVGTDGTTLVSSPVSSPDAPLPNYPTCPSS
jgi:hypothetical protein